MAEKEQVHYIHRLSYTARERLVGVFVLLAILLLFLTVAFNRQTEDFFAPKFTLQPTSGDLRFQRVGLVAIQTSEWLFTCSMNRLNMYAGSGRPVSHGCTS